MKKFAIAAAMFVSVVALSLAADDNEKALKEIQGEYKLKALSKGGMPAPDELLKVIEDFKIKDDVISFKVGGDAKSAKIKLDVSKKPAQIDLTPLEGPEKDKTKPGVFKFEKGELILVIAEDGDRPGELEDKTDKQMKLVLTKKEK